MAARVARRRRAKFRRGVSGRIEPVDEASAAILRQATDDIAQFLGYADTAAYDAAPAEERQQRAWTASVTIANG